MIVVRILFAAPHDLKPFGPKRLYVMRCSNTKSTSISIRVALHVPERRERNGMINRPRMHCSDGKSRFNLLTCFVHHLPLIFKNNKRGCVASDAEKLAKPITHATCTCICMCAFECACMCVCVCAPLCLGICMCAHACVCMRLCMCACTPVCIHAHACVCLCVRMRMRVSVCVCAYVCALLQMLQWCA